MISGLTTAQVEERVAKGLINDVPDAPVRSFSQIVKANVLTPVNGIITTLLVLILIAGYPADALFAGVVVSNSVIGIAQELQARRTLNALAVLSAPKARVRRNGETSEIGVSGVVADDVLELAPGDQVVVDGEVISGLGLEIDESLLTGEADAVEKTAGSEVLSGSFVSAGSGTYRATRVGAESYAAKLSEDARRFKLAHSELRRGVNVILRWLTWIIPPTAFLLLLRQLAALDAWQEALQATVAAAVAMVPDGLVLLTSLSFVTGVIALARRRALAKELASVELLARVDTLCLDKTGTITTGEISLGLVEPLGSFTSQHAAEALGALAAADPSPNATLAAVATGHPEPQGWELSGSLSFSSARKWAAASFADRGSYFLGAPDILFNEDDADGRDRAAQIAATGTRVLLVARSDEPWNEEALPQSVQGVALVHLKDTVRSDAPEILAFFRDQGVTLKVISGDNPATVAAVARRAGIEGADSFVDARDLPTEPDDFADALEAETVFGRVTPHQKRAMVHALQARGRTVAMTGDGVNDVLALKDADMGIAMGSGSSSTRAVAQLVLLDNKFSTLPRVLAEGRRVINNIERVANLFITKAAYAVLLTALASIIGAPFPFLPRQLTLIGTFSIGVPGFFLALAPNDALVRPGFLKRVLRFSLPAGLIAGAATYALYEVVRRMPDVSLTEARTASTATLLAIVLVILVLVSLPLKPAKIALPIVMTGVYVLTLSWSFSRDYFQLDLPPGPAWAAVVIASIIGAVAVTITTRILDE
ncbi:MAG: HAD-IC family P-type ATPase [Acidimicrobiaceae bacterium]|nr:HAD-IC family P-type ATPase [Acidimicrobiaceae bacterium]